LKVLTTKQIIRREREAETRFGILPLILMENAGRAVADEIESTYARCKTIICLCGKGNNGGDGFVAARHLKNRGYHVRVVQYGELKHMKADAYRNFLIVKKMKIPLMRNPSLARLRRMLKGADLIVDALFGTGLSRDLRLPWTAILQEINRARRRVVSIDIPSGLNSDTGKVQGEVIRASMTITLGFAKMGLFKGFAKHCKGKLIVADISFPKRA
jgi:hydroxyethylthiazole kinase-like uncharacterized protein yjeF